MSSPARRIRVLVADDSAAVRSVLQTLLSEDARLEVVGQAADGVEAVAQAKRLRPDVITMDVAMPRMDGLTAIETLMSEAPCRILVVSAMDERQTDLSFRAMAAGALEVLPKPTLLEAHDLKRWGRRVAEAVRLMAEVPVVSRRRSTPAPALRQGSGAVVDAFGIVASTGGPPALAQLLGALPADLPIPLFIAQHLALGFTAGLARWLSSVSPLAIVVAQNGQPALAGHAYLAPDGRHLEVDSEGLLRIPSVQDDLWPSGNRLLASLAAAYRNRAGGAVLTGMGEDGATGLLAIHNAGGVTLAQDEASSVVAGMPLAAQAAGATRDLLPLESIAVVIRTCCKRPGSPLPRPPDREVVPAQREGKER